MITIDQAVRIARAHLDANPLPQAEYRNVLREPEEMVRGWFFAYGYERVDGQPLGPGDTLLGAAGFIVSKLDGSVEVSALIPPELYERPRSARQRRRWWRLWW